MHSSALTIFSAFQCLAESSAHLGKQTVRCSLTRLATSYAAARQLHMTVPSVSLRLIVAPRKQSPFTRAICSCRVFLYFSGAGRTTIATRQAYSIHLLFFVFFFLQSRVFVGPSFGKPIVEASGIWSLVTPTVNMRPLHRLVLIYIVIFAIGSEVAAAQLPSPRAGSSLAIDPHWSFILQTNREANQAAELKDTITFIDGLHSAPACTQLASSRLITDCSLLDNPTEFAKAYPNQVLEDIQNEYALKLAVCEYVGVHHTHPNSPPNCQAFLPSKKACVKRSWLWTHSELSDDDICYPTTTKADLTQCLATMQSSPQMWTSYSNARSRAMNICHLSRQHIDKEEALRLYKNLTRVVSNLYDHLQPLESTFSAMEDRLHTWSDETQQFFEKSHQTAESFTRLVQETHEKHQSQLDEANQSLRSMQQQVDTLQEEAKVQYMLLHSEFEARMKASLAKGAEVIAYNQANSLTQFTKNMGVVYQSLTQELFEQFERYNVDLQEYHDRNMLAIQQQHKTQIKSFEILQTGIKSVTSSVEYLENKTKMLETELNQTMIKIGTVNDGLSTLASIAQTAGQLMNGFDTALSYFIIVGAVLGLAFFANCVSRVPLIGNAYRNLVMTLMAILVCGLSLHATYRLLSIPEEMKKWVDILTKLQVPEWGYLWVLSVIYPIGTNYDRSLLNSVYICLASCSMLSICAVLVNGPTEIFPRILSCRRISSQHALPSEGDAMNRTSLQVMSNPTLPIVIQQQDISAYKSNSLLLQEAQEDIEVYSRIRGFQRASTIS